MFLLDKNSAAIILTSFSEMHREESMKWDVLLTLLIRSATTLVLSAMSEVHATELRVIGTIVPDACLPAFSDQGVVDYGPVSSAEHGVVKILAKKSVALSVSCALPSRVAIRLIDNRDSADIPQMQAVSARHRNKKHLFGLGTQTGRNAGGYIISFESAHPALPPPLLMESASNINATRWTLTSDNALRKNVLYSWDAEHKIHPGGTLEFQATLGIQAVIDSSDNTQVKDGSQLDGSITFELLYL